MAKYKTFKEAQEAQKLDDLKALLKFNQIIREKGSKNAKSKEPRRH